MGDKTDIEVLLEHVPALDVWYTAFLTYIYHFIIFILVMVFFWLICSTIWIAALPTQIMMASVSNVPLIYVTKNFDKIREKYLKKYQKKPWQHFWYHYSYTSPFGCAALYAPLLLKTDYFLPALIDFPSHFMTLSLFPVYIALPLGVFIIIFGILLVKPSQDSDRDFDFYLYIINPKKSRLINDGIYNYIRHPRILSRLTLAVGFGILANNILAISVALIHLLPYCVYMKAEDKEIVRKFGKEINIYQKKVPALFPRFSTWSNFFGLILKRKKN